MDLVSTQEYQEDERRRTDLLDESIKDMFENSSETIEEVAEDLERRWVHCTPLIFIRIYFVITLSLFPH